jgi:hydrogenase-4 membrane subunit HyfE
MENGLYMATLATTYGLPTIVELLITLDVSIAVIIFGVFLFSMNKNIQSFDTTLMKELTEE